MNNMQRMVTVALKGFLDDGSVFLDQTNPPLEFPCIDGWMPPTFIEIVSTMDIGQTRCVRISSSDAYEPRTEKRIFKVPMEKVPSGAKVGDVIHLESPDGHIAPARFINVCDNQAVFDANHDVVCKSLNFEFTLLNVCNLPQR